jgi:hypothetical protein
MREVELIICKSRVMDNAIYAATCCDLCIAAEKDETQFHYANLSVFRKDANFLVIGLPKLCEKNPLCPSIFNDIL